VAPESDDIIIADDYGQPRSRSQCQRLEQHRCYGHLCLHRQRLRHLLLLGSYHTGRRRLYAKRRRYGGGQRGPTARPKPSTASASTKTQPEITLNVTGSTAYPAGYTLDFSASDALSGLAQPVSAPSLTDANGNSVDVPNGYQFNLPGDYTLTIAATDLAGNTNTTAVAAITITAASTDTTAPFITITSPAEYGLYTISSGAPIAFFATDGESGVASLTATLNDTSPITSGALVNTPGVHTLTVSAADYAGNSSSKTVTFIVYDPTGALLRRRLVFIRDPAVPFQETKNQLRLRGKKQRHSLFRQSGIPVQGTGLNLKAHRSAG